MTCIFTQEASSAFRFGSHHVMQSGKVFGADNIIQHPQYTVDADPRSSVAGPPLFRPHPDWHGRRIYSLVAGGISDHEIWDDLRLFTSAAGIVIKRLAIHNQANRSPTRA